MVDEVGYDRDFRVSDWQELKLQRGQTAEITFKGILAKADRFRTQVAGHADVPEEVRNPEPGERMATELFLDGLVAAQTLDKGQIKNLVDLIDQRENDQNWIERYRNALKLSAEDMGEWAHQRHYATTARGKITGALKKAMGADTGINPKTGREK